MWKNEEARDESYRRALERNRRPLLSHGRAMSDDELLARLRQIGFDVQCQGLVDGFSNFVSAEAMSQGMIAGAGTGIPESQVDWVWIATTPVRVAAVRNSRSVVPGSLGRTSPLGSRVHVPLGPHQAEGPVQRPYRLRILAFTASQESPEAGLLIKLAPRRVRPASGQADRIRVARDRPPRDNAKATPISKSRSEWSNGVAAWSVCRLVTVPVRYRERR